MPPNKWIKSFCANVIVTTHKYRSPLFKRFRFPSKPPMLRNLKKNTQKTQPLQLKWCLPTRATVANLVNFGKEILPHPTKRRRKKKQAQVERKQQISPQLRVNAPGKRSPPPLASAFSRKLPKCCWLLPFPPFFFCRAAK